MSNASMEYLYKREAFNEAKKCHQQFQLGVLLCSILFDGLVPAYNFLQFLLLTMDPIIDCI